MSRLALYLLGPPRIELDGAELHIPRRKALALLAYLAVEPDRQSRDVLATLFWPDYDQSSARGRLRRTLSTLNRTLGEGWLAVERERVGVNPDVGLWLDVDQFRQRLTVCETHGHLTDQPCPDCLAHLTEAAELYRDDFMSGFTLPDSLGFDEWQRYQADRLRDELAGILERLSACHAAQGEFDSAIATAGRWLELDPLRERAHRRLMELYAQAGRRTAALRQYRACMRVLEGELGVLPSAETMALYERIRAGQAQERPDLTGEETVVLPDAVVALPAFLREEAVPWATEAPVFVARERELAQLDGYLEAALAGRGQVAFVTGGPGRGKSALMAEFVRQAMDRHPDLLATTGTCNAYSGVGDPYLPFREVMSMLTGDVEGRYALGAITRDHALRLWQATPLTLETLMDQDPHLVDVFLPGRGLLSRVQTFRDCESLKASLEQWVNRVRGEGADLASDYLYEQYTQALRRLAAQCPLLVSLDDLQWADGPSIQLLFHLGRRLAEEGSRVLVVGAYRGEEVALGRNDAQHPLEPVLTELKRRYGDVWIDLGRTDEAGARRFVDAYLDSEPNQLNEDFRAVLYRRTGGHPLFTVELLRAMQARGDLTKDPDGAWVDTPVLDWEMLPARMEAVIEARLSRLDDRLCDILRVASVEGERFTAQVVAHVQGLPDREVLRALSLELGQGGRRLVKEAGEQVGKGRFLSRYQFTHALYQTYVYDRLVGGERRLLHRDVGTALETLYGDARDEIAAALANHFTEAGQQEKAAIYTLQAGEQARLVYANEEAVAYFEQVLELIPPSPFSSPLVGETEAAQTRLAALKGLARTCIVIGRADEAETYVREAIALGKELNLTPRELARLYWLVTETLFWQGHQTEEVVQLGEKGLRLLENDLESVEAVLLHNLIGTYHIEYRDDAASWIAHLNHFEPFIQRLPYTEELRAPYVLTIERYAGKDAATALRWAEALATRAARHGDWRALGEAHWAAAGALTGCGDFAGAITRCQKALEQFDRIADAPNQARSFLRLGRLHLNLGNIARAEACSTQALDIARSMHLSGLIYFAYVLIGAIALHQEAWEDAVTAFRRARAYLKEPPRPLDLIIGNHGLGRAYLGLGRKMEALCCFENAVTAAISSTASNWAVVSGLAHALSLWEATCDDQNEFRSACGDLRQENRHDVHVPFTQWCLDTVEENAEKGRILAHEVFDQSFASAVQNSGLPSDWVQSSDWEWHDPFGDSLYRLQDGLEMHAANGRDLRRANVSAPRLLRPAPVGSSWAIETVCNLAVDPITGEALILDGLAASQARPAIGGLLLWLDEQNYLRLDVGSRGANEISFQGRFQGVAKIFGRGRLLLREPRVWLRFERAGEMVKALCSADGERWFKAGSAAFHWNDRLQVGLHAIGMIDFSLYGGACVDGTAIRFESFTLCELDG